MLENSLKKAFIDQNTRGSIYDPRLIINQSEKDEYLINTLQEDLSNCRGFIFSVAFLTQAGLNTLKAQLHDLALRGISGKLITSDYLYFNNPDVFESLLKIPNLQVRISPREGFHSKGYLFDFGDYQSFIIGSSNLTMNALKVNYEWNIRLTSYQHGQVIQSMCQHLKSQWQEAKPLSPEWIASYRSRYQPIKLELDKSHKNVHDKINEPTQSKTTKIKPNKMQETALASLRDLRDSGAKRGLVVSATGTGKTYLAALDVRSFKPKRMLFIVHQEQILQDAKNSFQRVIGGSSYDYGILSGNHKETDAKYLFATIQSISKPENYELFEKDHFDYILIDEVHRAGADSYLRVIDYFEPEFLLGMTATPERTDGFNIFELFDYNLAYEIRLQEALEEDMLCPFHYFGVTDYEKDGQVISQTTDLKYLTLDERVEFLIEKIDYYGVSGNRPCGLVFCSRVEEAFDLAEAFSQRGIKSASLSGKDSIEERIDTVQKLEDGEISYIFTVDIFNEGVDLPKVNQIVMLRNTQSPIIFVQQMGRGLRKHESKDFVTIIDFIGNYQNNYMIPMALTGDTSGNKNKMVESTYQTQYLSGLSMINFEEIARDKIFESIESAKLSGVRNLDKHYKQLKNRLNRPPLLYDFKTTNTLDPLLFNEVSGYTTYYDFLVRQKDNKGVISEGDNYYLKFISRELLPGIRRHDLVLLQDLIKSSLIQLSRIKNIFERNGLKSSPQIIRSVIDTLTCEYYLEKNHQKTYNGVKLASLAGENLILDSGFSQALENDYFKLLVSDLVKTGLEISKNYGSDGGLTRYQTYKRNPVLRLLGWDKDMPALNIGGYTYSRENKTFVIFVIMDKDEEFDGAEVAYDNHFLGPDRLLWYTKSSRTLDSPESQILLNPTGWNFHLFARKMDNQSADHYYLGQVHPDPATVTQTKVFDDKGLKRDIVHVELVFDQLLSDNFYKYIK